MDQRKWMISDSQMSQATQYYLSWIFIAYCKCKLKTVTETEEWVRGGKDKETWTSSLSRNGQQEAWENDLRVWQVYIKQKKDQ